MKLPMQGRVHRLDVDICRRTITLAIRYGFRSRYGSTPMQDHGLQKSSLVESLCGRRYLGRTTGAATKRGTNCPSGHPGPRGDEGNSLQVVSVIKNLMPEQA